MKAFLSPAATALRWLSLIPIFTCPACLEFGGDPGDPKNLKPGLEGTWQVWEQESESLSGYYFPDTMRFQNGIFESGTTRLKYAISTEGDAILLIDRDDDLIITYNCELKEDMLTIENWGRVEVYLRKGSPPPQFQVQEVSFSGNHAVYADGYPEVTGFAPGGAYQAPHWTGEPAGTETLPRRFPVHYTRGQDLQIGEVVFQALQSRSIPDAWSDRIQVRGITSQGIVLEGTGKLNRKQKSIVAKGLKGDFPLADTVLYLPSFSIRWEISVNGRQYPVYRSAGTTENPLFATLDHPVAGRTQESALYLACQTASGTSHPSTTVSAIWNQFSLRNVRAKPKDGFGQEDLRPLIFWDRTSPCCDSGSTGRPNAITVEQLLGPDFTEPNPVNGEPEGSGQCTSWVQLWQECLNAHGETSGNSVRIQPQDQSTYRGFLVKAWQFPKEGMGNLCVNVQPEMSSYAQGQNNAAPVSTFTFHQVYWYDNHFWDPSYGSKTAGSGLMPRLGAEVDYENQNVDGLLREIRTFCTGVVVDQIPTATLISQSLSFVDESSPYPPGNDRNHPIEASDSLENLSTLGLPAADSPTGFRYPLDLEPHAILEVGDSTVFCGSLPQGLRGWACWLAVSPQGTKPERGRWIGPGVDPILVPFQDGYLCVRKRLPAWAAKDRPDKLLFSFSRDLQAWIEMPHWNLAAPVGSWDLIHLPDGTYLAAQYQDEAEISLLRLTESGSWLKIARLPAPKAVRDLLIQKESTPERLELSFQTGTGPRTSLMISLGY
ncbi:MAG: hypothetical protein DWQ01_01680 [Planctomycetota bacterium]|nr:MAG: hypothetical protein DWQ01_01680 [Planctomycetota bacterium]